jgi:hypothetical protein
VHLEMGLLRLINAQRLAPMEELLAELRGGPATGAAGAAGSGSGGRRASAAAESATASLAGRAFFAGSAATTSAWQIPATPTAGPGNAGAGEQTPASVQPTRPAAQPNAFVAAASAPVPLRPTVAASFAAAAPAPAREENRRESKPTGRSSEPKTSEANDAFAEAEAEVDVDASEIEAPGAEAQVASAGPSASGATRADGITAEQVAEIKSAIQAQQKFLGEIIGHGHRWELEGAELRIYFSADKRPFAEMMEGRDALEKIRAASSKVLGRAVRVCAKVDLAAAGSARAASSTQELRAQFEGDAMVRSMLQRFGGRISEVKWGQEES